MDLVNSVKQRGQLAAVFLVLAWVVFAADFIARSSHVSTNDVRYFTLFDDGMIGMRYARNLVEHHAPVWNLGDRVEGVTDPLWIFIMAGTIWTFGVRLAPLAMQILGGVTCLAVFAVFWSSAKRRNVPFLGAALGLLFLVTAYPLAYWGLGGMEASAICLLYAVAASVQYSYEEGSANNPLLLHSMLIVFAYCLRPDGWLGIVPFFAACWFDSVKCKKYGRAFLAPLIPVLFVLTLLLARHAYYGEWVPNTYVLKVEGYSLALRLRNGLVFVTPFCRENVGALALIVISTFVRRRMAFLNCAAAAIVLGYQIYIGGDPWLYWRQLLPVYVATSFSILILFRHLTGLPVSKLPDVPQPNRLDLLLKVVVLLLPLALIEYLTYAVADYEGIYRRPLLILYLLVASGLLVSMMKAAPNSEPWPAGRSSILLCKMAFTLVVLYSIALGNVRFRPEFGRNKPALYEGEATIIDRAVFANRVFGPGKTHHLIWAGAYGYFVEGTMIDALGKSDRKIARYPVDELVTWDGMKGVPGHAKHNFHESILQRRPDIVVQPAHWGREDVSAEMKDSYVLLRSAEGVGLCVRKELSAGKDPLVRGSCPRSW